MLRPERVGIRAISGKCLVTRAAKSIQLLQDHTSRRSRNRGELKAQSFLCRKKFLTVGSHRQMEHVAS